jgi:chromosomal replication initiator protein
MKTLWQDIKNQIRSEVSKKSFSLWIDPLTFQGEKDSAIILGCPNKFSRNWILEHYLGLIKEKLCTAGQGPLDLLLKIQSPRRKPLPDPYHPAQLCLPNMPAPQGRGKIRLNTDFTFERFIKGPCNEFALSASKAMAREGSSDYPCLLMLAGTGLGKSHLSHAVGHAILQSRPQSRVHYVTAEEFANEMIFSLKNHHIEAFKDKYRRSCDVLLLEEIHFLSGKEKIQAELGYALDALANDHKKIICTSALPPKDIPRLNKGLSSRLTSGLVTTIQGPDYQTRLNILSHKAAEQGLSLSEEILHILAGRLKRDIRQMESALRCLKARAELLKATIDRDLANEVLRHLSSTEASISSKDILSLVCTYYKVPREMLQSKSRKKIYAYPRNVYVYLCRHHTDETLDAIARSINRSHPAALYAADVVASQIKTHDKTRHQIRFLNQKLEDMKK